MNATEQIRTSAFPRLRKNGMIEIEEAKIFQACYGTSIEARLLTQLFGLSEEEAEKYKIANEQVKSHLKKELQTAEREAPVVFVGALSEKKEKLSILKKLINDQATLDEELEYMVAVMHAMYQAGFKASLDELINESREIISIYKAM